MQDAVFYRPSAHGFEQEIAMRMNRIAAGGEGPDAPAGPGPEDGGS
jgi:hypothetical protein